jgi:PAS domain S-box-containing protein
LAQQGAYQLFQQGALLAQSQNTKQQALAIGPTIPSGMMSNVAQPGQEQRTDQHTTPQFTFATDTNAFLRQLQVAQLQQQFNAVQHGRPSAQQAIGAAPQTPQVSAGMQQQIQFQAQVPIVAPVPVVAQPAAAGPTKVRAPPQKKPPASQTREPSKQTSEAGTSSSKAPVVSASDTDGELSSKLGSTSSKGSKKTAAALAAARKAKLEIDTSNMSPEEKAKANRDRNREHARNTRLRKKAYLEKLKSTVDELCRERDTLVSERAGAANILVEMHNTRTEVLMSFFALRSANEKRRELWASILDESCFACVLPVTPYRSFPASEVQVSKCQRTILGIDGMMSDTASLHVLLNSLVDRSRFPNATIVFRYTLVTEEAVVAGNQMMARWVMTTLNATQCGARMEVAKQGMLCCKFNSAHKIIGLELMFDVMALMLQLKQAAGSDTFSVIPNTVQTCQRSFDKPMVMTLAEEPYTIVQVNKLWEEMTGYKAEDVVGKASCRILEGEETEPTAVEVLMNEIRFKRPASAMAVNYRKSGERFRNFSLAYPLSTDSRITHYLSLSTHVDAVLASGSTSSETLSVQQSRQGIVHASNPEPSVVAAQLPTAQLVSSAAPQANFYGGMPNLQGSVSAGQPALSHPSSQQLFGHPPVLSNALSTAPAQGTMLPPSLAAPSTNAVMQQYSLNALKRAHGGEMDAGDSRKQAKTGDVVDTKLLLPSTNAHPK